MTDYSTLTEAWLYVIAIFMTFGGTALMFNAQKPVLMLSAKVEALKPFNECKDKDARTAGMAFLMFTYFCMANWTFSVGLAGIASLAEVPTPMILSMMIAGPMLCFVRMAIFNRSIVGMSGFTGPPRPVHAILLFPITALGIVTSIVGIDEDWTSDNFTNYAILLAVSILVPFVAEQKHIAKGYKTHFEGDAA